MVEIATPDLYRTNAFRVLGLSVDVSSGDLAKHQRKMKVLEKLGQNGGRDQLAILPLDPPPDGDAVRRAGQQLRDPDSRLVHELFWFWPADPGGSDRDDAMGFMYQGDLTKVQRTWTHLIEQNGKYRPVSIHNLAVLHHAIALDMEQAAGLGTGQPDPHFTARRDKHWLAALRHWATVVGDDSVWDRIGSRIRELDDPRLTASFARRLRRTMPAMLLTISIRLAVSAAKQGDTGDSRRHLAYVRDSHLDDHLVETLLDREVAPLVEQIKQMCASVAERSKLDPKNADGLAERLMSDTQPLLSPVCAVLNQDHHLRQSALDNVAEMVLTCVRAFGKDTEDWHKCSALLEQALSLAVSDDLRERIQGDKTTVAGIEKSEEIAHFCKAAVEAAEANGAAADGEASRVLREASVLIARLQQSGINAAEISQARDMLAMTALQCAVVYGNTTEHWPACAQILRECLGLAVSQEARGKIEENLRTVEKNAKFGDLQRIESAPSLETANGWIGFTLYGCTDHDSETDSFMATYYFIVAAIPVFPICRYRVIQNGKSYRFLGKAPLRRGDKIHLGISIALILLLIGYWLISSGSGTSGTSSTTAAPNGNSTPRYSSPQPPTPNPISPRPSTPQPTYSFSGLSSRIDSGKAHARSMESEIEKMDTHLDLISGGISRSKQKIEEFERQSQLGTDVDRSLYQEALDNHNFLVRQHNSLLSERKAKYAEYSREIDAVNDMVRRYNSGER